MDDHDIVKLAFCNQVHCTADKSQDRTTRLANREQAYIMCCLLSNHPALKQGIFFFDVINLSQISFAYPIGDILMYINHFVIAIVYAWINVHMSLYDTIL